MKINFTETVLRDAQQSLIATRMPFSDYEHILKEMNSAGYYSLECWGGAVFDSCLRYLDEDPWERLRKIRAACPDVKLQMLLRGQNLLGYKHYPDDIVRMFVRKSVENGIDIIRIFDALNDLRNVEVAIDETLKCGAHPQGTVCYTSSPIHNPESFVKLAKQLEQMGSQSICIKDMAGILPPNECFKLVRSIKEAVKIPVVVHTHSTAGLGQFTLKKAAEAGADVIDTAISCFSGGTAQPPTEILKYVLEEEGFQTDLDVEKLKKINNYFKTIQKKVINDNLLNPLALTTDVDALHYQVPGGMLSNLMAQLTQAGKLDLLEDVLREVPRVRADLGYPPLVTPMSQMVGTQATFNILTGERYKTVSKEVKSYFLGEYGQPAGELNPEVQKKIIGDETPYTGRFADTLEPGFEKAKAEIGDLAKCDEDVLSYALFPVQAKEFLTKREEKKKNTFTYSIRKVD